MGANFHGVQISRGSNFHGFHGSSNPQKIAEF